MSSALLDTSLDSADQPLGNAGQDQRKTKIVCTLGPASNSAAKIHGLIAAGANVIRLNFSHSDHDWHARALAAVRSVTAGLDHPVAVLQDLCGPKIRVSHVPRADWTVAEGDRIRITTDRHVGSSRRTQAVRFDISSTYEALIDDVAVGDRILLHDGRLELEVAERHTNYLVARVVRGGRIAAGTGMNLPGVALSTDSMTEKDWSDLEWGIARDVEFIALSFVRSPQDLIPLRERLDQAGSRARLIAKIERPEAVEHIDQILELADGLMVARGDLGLETELSHVPMLQKRLIERCRLASKPVITATQMLESMVSDATPTRAEVSDVANAIYDGTDAVMLSAETATGKHPRAAVEMLDKVARVTEADLARMPELRMRRSAVNSAAAAIVEGAAATALSLRARRLVVYSQTGLTARLMAQHRLPMPVVAVTNTLATSRQLSLSFGVEPIYLPDVVSLPQLLEKMDHLVLERHWGDVGDALVVVSALDGRDGNTDTLHVHRVKS